MKPDDPIVRHYLAHSMVMRLATISASGNASITPLWFVVHHGQLLASTGATSVAARNSAADRRVTLLLDGEMAGPSQFAVRLAGAVEVRTGLPPVRAMARFAAKYYLAPRGLRSELAHLRQWPLRSRYYAQSQAVVLMITPTQAELIPMPRCGVRSAETAPSAKCSTTSATRERTPPTITPDLTERPPLRRNDGPVSS